MEKVIIYGTGDMAEIAHYFLQNDSKHIIVAFCIEDNKYKPGIFFKGLPIVSFETVEKIYPIDEFGFFAPISSEKMNTIRESVYNKIKSKGYQLINYISSKAITSNATFGDNCFILAGNILQPFTSIGNNVMLWSSSLVAHHSVVKDHVTFASHVALAARCSVGENSFLGTNSTIRNRTILAKGTLVGLGTTITKNTEEWGVYIGNPAKKIGNRISKSILKI